MSPACAQVPGQDAGECRAGVRDWRLRSVSLAAPELNKREGTGPQGHRTFTHADFTNEDVAPRLRELR